MTFPLNTTSSECRCPMTLDRVGPRGTVEVLVVFVDHGPDCLVLTLATIEAAATGGRR